MPTDLHALRERNGTALRKKDQRWLEHVALMCRLGCGGMYSGARVDHVPHGPANRLWKAGLITEESPHNPVHKERWVLTIKGRAALGEPQE